MKKSQFKFSILLVLIPFISALCSSGDETNYFPLGVGARWDYSMKFIRSSGIIDGTSVVRVEGIEEIEVELQAGRKIREKFVKLSTLYSGIPGIEKDLQYYRKFQDGLYVVQKSLLNMLIPTPIKIGETWKISFQDDTLGSYTMNMTIEGIETLELLYKEGDIKRYDNCLKIVGINKKLNLTTTDYYAPNIGVVKSVISFPRMFGIEMILQKYSKGKEVPLKTLKIKPEIQESEPDLKKQVPAFNEIKEETTRKNMTSLEKVIDIYIKKNGKTPTDLKELRTFSRSVYVDSDAWGTSFKYERISDSKYSLISAGNDKTFNTEDDIIIKN